MNLSPRLLLCLFLCGCQAVGGTPPPAVADKAPARPVDARVETAAAEVTRLVGAAACTRDDECRSSPWGVMACGGPAAFVAWSATQTDAEALQRALNELAAARRAQIRERGEASICVMQRDPGAYCSPSKAASRYCKLRPLSDDMKVR